MEPDILKTDFYLKLTSEADMPTVLSAFYKQDSYTETDADGNETTVLDGDPYLVTHTADYVIDVVGVIQKPTGNILTDADGFEYEEIAPLDGWHINIRLMGDEKRAIVESMDAQYGVAPVTPERVWL